MHHNFPGFGLSYTSKLHILVKEKKEKEKEAHSTRLVFVRITDLQNVLSWKGPSRFWTLLAPKADTQNSENAE